MNPNGFVAAASMTSQTSISTSWQSMAISFASAMFTWRNVFSSSFASSAARHELTGITLSTSCS